MLIRRSQNEINQNRCQSFITSLDNLVPEDHILRLINKFFDWDFIYDLTEGKYSKESSRPALDPVVFFKILFLNYLENLGSIRNTCRQIKTNVAYRWFLGLSIEEKVPDPSTISKTLSRRYIGTDIFNQIFTHILECCFEHDLIDPNEIYIDSTHVKANANPHKYVQAYVENEVAHFQQALEEEVNLNREEHGKKPLKKRKTKSENTNESNENSRKDPELILYNGELVALEEVEVDLENYESKKVSKTDCQSGWFHKGEHKQLFAYIVQAACDKNKYILSYASDAGNKHDSRTFYNIYSDVASFYPAYAILDAGYKTPAIAKDLIDAQIIPVMPYKRPMTKKGFMRKSEYCYDEYYDCYICPNDKILSYSTTTREGYQEYKSNPQDCLNCPFLEKCTLSKNHTKVITRHVWAPYIEECEDIRHTPQGKELYANRKKTIELVFGDCKENFGFRFTRFTGQEKMDMVAALTFSSYNLVKMVRRLDTLEKREQSALDKASSILDSRDRLHSLN